MDFELGNCFVKGPGSALENHAAIVNPENKPTKVNWTLSWPSALEICGKLFFNKGLISGLILLGKVWILNLAIALVKGPESALENFAAIVNPENTPTKVNWTLSWPSALEIRGKTVLYSGFNKRSDSFGNSRQARFFAEQMSSFF